MIKLQDMRAGDWVRWNSGGWEVTDRTTYRGSSDYSETQWELTPASGGSPHYLVRSLENKPGGVEEVWVCTKQTGIGAVQYQGPSGGWTSFQDKDSLKTPPDRARYNGLELSLDGETEGKAKDDDGNTVTKLTWDYYDASRKHNVAIEIWKESDADYYEAYDGLVVAPSEFSPMPSPAGAGRGRFKLEDAGSNLVVFVFAAFFMLPIVGGLVNVFDAGAEYLAALLLPAACIYLAYQFGAHRGLLFSSLALTLAFSILLLRFAGLGLSYWKYFLYGAIAGPLIAEALAVLFGGVRPSDKSASAANSTLLLMFVVSFAHYIKFAPRPHNVSGLLAACLLPVFPALAVFTVYLFKGGSDEQA